MHMPCRSSRIEERLEVIDQGLRSMLVADPSKHGAHASKAAIPGVAERTMPAHGGSGGGDFTAAAEALSAAEDGAGELDVGSPRKAVGSPVISSLSPEKKAD